MPQFFKILYSTFLALSLPFALTGCIAFVDAVNDGPIQIDPTRRSYGDVLNDRTLQTIIAVNIRKAHKELAKAGLHVYSYQSVVLLLGQVSSAEIHELAGKTARQVNGVRQVYNEIQVSEKLGFFRKISDTFVATKIKTKLLFNSKINSKLVKVFVEDGTVFLMGKLTKETTEDITNIVKKEKGVKKVIRAIEYVN